MIVTMSGLHKAVPGQNELKRIRDQILILPHSSCNQTAFVTRGIERFAIKIPKSAPGTVGSLYSVANRILRLVLSGT